MAGPAQGAHLVASVIPLVSAWRLDRAFDYSVPDALTDRLREGSLVRVPLGARRVRGVVVGLGRPSSERDLEDVVAVLGPAPVAPHPLVDLAEWMARRYAAQRGAVFARVVPPRIRVASPAVEAISGGPHPERLLGYEGGAALLGALGDGGGVWVVAAVAGEDRSALIAELVAAAGRAAPDAAALVAVPEVRYGSKVIAGLEADFPNVARLDSSVGDPARAASWFRMAAGHGLGAGGRGVVLAPAPRLRLVVVDEEHHVSYKEDRSPRYDARRVAVERARAQGATCVFVSASPSLEALHMAASGAATLVEPSVRRRRAARPLVEFVEHPADRALSHALHERMRDALAAGGRVALLAPRRGFASAVWCASCRRSLRCPRCEAGLVFDRAPRRLRCPRCRLEESPPPRCPNCGADDFRLMGAGSERLAEQLAKSFPRARVRRVDPDVLADGVARDDDVDIYVTTWIGTKEVLRPTVSLVGVIDADALIHRPDWRAAESAYQALVEMAEWVGPGERGGRLVVQTAAPTHHVLQALVRGDVRFFAERELERRRELFYPPFSELIKVRAEGAGAEDLVAAAAAAARGEGARVLGPISVRAGGADGLELLVKCEAAEPVAEALRGILPTVPAASRLRVDVDPR